MEMMFIINSLRISVIFIHASKAAAIIIGKKPRQRQPSIIDSKYASCYAAEDQLKNIIGRSNNESYKPWKNKYAPKNPHSPFGDFPPDYLPKQKVE